RDKVRVVLRASGDQLAAQARVFVHFQHVDAHVRHAAGNCLVERIAPALARLVRQAGDQVHVDVADARGAQPSDVSERLLARVQPRHRSRFLVHKRLHPEAHTVYAAVLERGDDLFRQRARGAFHCDLGVAPDQEILAQRHEESLQLIRRKQAGRTAAEINGIGRLRKLGAVLGGNCTGRAGVGNQPVDVLAHLRRRKHAGGKVAVRALGAAERNRNVDAKKHSGEKTWSESTNHASIIESIPMLKRAVVTGMGVVSPNGIGNTAFCRAVLDGKSGVKLISRFDTTDVPVKIAGEIANGDFNELDWGDARERKHVSRCVPLAIAAGTEALRDAGIDPTKLTLDQQREIGVVLGTGGGANDFTDLQYHLYYQGKIKQVSIFTIPSGTMGTMSSEISMRFGFRGPSQVVTSGCTSSTDAIAYAVRQIQLGTQPAMLAGGTDSPLAWGILKAFILMRIMTESWNHAPERGSRPFNLDRDGFVIAEGSWMFVIEEYERARARGAHIYAEV